MSKHSSSSNANNNSSSPSRNDDGPSHQAQAHQAPITPPPPFRKQQQQYSNKISNSSTSTANETQPLISPQPRGRGCGGGGGGGGGGNYHYYSSPPIRQDNSFLSHDGTDESEAERRDAFRSMSIIAFTLVTILISLRYATSWFFMTDDPSKVKISKTTATTGPLDNDNDNDGYACPEHIPFCRRPYDDDYYYDNSTSTSSSYNMSRDHHHHHHVRIVQQGLKGFPSFWDYAPHGSINVTYDGRSFLLNGDRVMFLSGSMHPGRATKLTWEHSLDLLVKNGANMITIYVFWADHQPLPNSNIDWTLPGGRPGGGDGGGTDYQHYCDNHNDDYDNDNNNKIDGDKQQRGGSGNNNDSNNGQPSYCGWTLADAIIAAAQRGLFVHARIGPYVCAEYSYGGIPEWVPLGTNMSMRRMDPQWLDAMEGYVISTINYLTENKLFAYQGGPIIAGQIENELGEENDDDDNDIPIMDDDMPPTERRRQQRRARSLEGHREVEEEEDERSNNISIQQKAASVQDYADWCGLLVQRLAPNVTWTMCNGLSAENTIVTCNGDCSTNWLENHGSSGRIQVDQPAIWSEDEGGFQIWGDQPTAPSDYFWGRTARAMAYDALRWFARGGTHLNYYMFWGSYNRGRASAAGIMNGYATDAPVCSSGEPREPKFGHFRAFHKALQQVAPILLQSPTQLNQSIDVEHQNERGEWEISGEQRMFVYRAEDTNKESHGAIFVENDSKSPVTVKIMVGALKNVTVIAEMNPFSAMLIKDGAILFDSFHINAAAMSFERKVHPAPVDLLGWSSCAEPIGASSAEYTTVEGSRPVEQTSLNIGAGISNDYAWYETQFHLNTSLEEASLFVESEKGSALTLYIDEVFQGEAYDRHHAEGSATFHFRIGPLSRGLHTMAILSESLGYHNLVGRWGAPTTSKVKGITGDVILATTNGNQSLVGKGLKWKSSPGLNGKEDGSCGKRLETQCESRGARWSTAMFITPIYDPVTYSLFLNVTKGRGHLWLNGHDLGRFWDIKRIGTDKFSQEFYFLPFDYLDATGGNNTIIFFDALGNDFSSTQLLLTWLNTTNSPNFKDEVDFSQACL